MSILRTAQEVGLVKSSSVFSAQRGGAVGEWLSRELGGGGLHAIYGPKLQKARQAGWARSAAAKGNTGQFATDARVAGMSPSQRQRWNPDGIPR